MATEIRVPALGESVTEATIGRWFKKPGELVRADEPIVELETDKVTLEVNAPASGHIGRNRCQGWRNGWRRALLGQIGDGAAAAPLKAETKPRPRPKPSRLRRLQVPRQRRGTCPARNACLARRRQDRRRSWL